MPADQTQSWAYTEDVCIEDAISLKARQQAQGSMTSCSFPRHLRSSWCHCSGVEGSFCC